MAVSYGTYTITEVQEGSQIWTSSAAPTTPNYTFDVSHLTGDSDIPVREGDIILNSYYRYTVLSISNDGTTVLTGNRTSIRGETGAASVTYALIVSNLAIVKDKDRNLSPSTITVTAKSQTGSNAMANYTGRIKIETTTNNLTWTSRINEDAATKTYTIPSDTVAIRCSLYLKGGTTTLLDQQTIPVVSDGTDGINGTNGKDGADGKDAYTVILTNENHTFAGNTTSAIASEIECNVIAYKGATQIAATIGTITGQTTGMTTSLLNNGTVNAAFKVNVTTSMVTKSGVLTVPITVDGKSFTKEFTYTLTLDGEDGKDGGRWYSGTKITGTSTTATIFADSGITSAVVGDMYLNTSTYNTYRCTVAGSASIAKWVYVNNIKGQIGDTGKGISSIENQYYLSSSNTQQTGGSWSTTVPNYETGKYYWTKSHITWTDGTETDTTPVLDNGITSANSNAEDARKVATNYLSIDNTGIMVADMEDGTQTPSGIESGNNVFVDSSSVNIRDGQTKLASFGIRGMSIGKDGESKILITNSDVTGVTRNNQQTFSISLVEDGEESEESKEITENSEEVIISATGFSTTYNIQHTPIADTTVYYQAIVTFKYDNDNSEVVATRTFSTSRVCEARDPDTDQEWTEDLEGEFEIVEITTEVDSGDVVSREAMGSISGGSTSSSSSSSDSSSSGSSSGSSSTSTGHNFGVSGYLFGDTQAKYFGIDLTVENGVTVESVSFKVRMSTRYSSSCAYTFGTRSGSIAEYSGNTFAIGSGLIANSPDQIALGKYNLWDSDYIFMVGDGIGSDDFQRSNAIAVDTSGNVNTKHINAMGGLTSLLDTSENTPISVVDVNDDIMFSVGRDGSVMASGTASISGAVSCGDDLSVNGNITIPTSKNISLANNSDYTTTPSTESKKNGIHASEYDGAMNNYYMSQGYHVFYAGGSGRVYIFDDNFQSNVPISAPNGFRSYTQELAIIRVSNSYCNADSISRLKAYKRSGILILCGNLNLSSALPTGTGETQIATVSGWDAITAVSVPAAAIQGSGTIHVTISTTGALKIANMSGSSASAWHRFQIVIPSTS